MNLSIADAAKKLGISRQHLNKVVAGKSAISSEMVIRLEANIGSTAQHWLAAQSAFELAQIR